MCERGITPQLENKTEPPKNPPWRSAPPAAKGASTAALYFLTASPLLSSRRPGPCPVHTRSVLHLLRPLPQSALRRGLLSNVPLLPSRQQWETECVCFTTFSPRKPFVMPSGTQSAHSRVLKATVTSTGNPLLGWVSFFFYCSEEITAIGIWADPPQIFSSTDCWVLFKVLNEPLMT